MLRTENANKEIIAVLHGKIQRDSEKLFKKISKNDQNEEDDLGEGLILGTEKNKNVLIGSLAPSGALIAVGLLQSLLGAVSYLPTLDTLERPVGEEAVRFFTNVQNFGMTNMKIGGELINIGAVLIAIPISVSAFSLSNKIHDTLIRKRKIKLNNNNVIVDLIDDLLEPSDEEDDTITFASKFINRVDLSENTDKANLEILKYLAYYRGVLLFKEQGKVNDEDVKNAYNTMMSFFKQIRDSKDTSESFKQNRYLNILINEYDEERKVENYIESKRSK